MNEIKKDVKLNLVNKFSVIRNRKIGICCSLFILNPFELILFGLKNGEIIVYSYPNINEIYSFQEHFKSINYICELNKNIISTASDDKTIKIIELKFTKIMNNKIDYKYKIIQVIFSHTHYVNKIISINANKFISCSQDHSIKIWNKKNIAQNYQLENTISVHFGRVVSIEKINKNEFVSSSWSEKIIYFFNINCYNIIANIKISGNYTPESICMINNKNLIIGGIGNFFLIDIEKHELIKIFENNENYYSIHSINDNLFICGCYNGSESIIYIKFLLNNELNNVCENKRNHKFKITSILQINNWNFISCSEDGTFIFWKIN